MLSSAPSNQPTVAPSPSSPANSTPRSCSYGEYRDAGTGACTQCASGTYWDQPLETLACLACLEGQVSLPGATRCYVPCQPQEALDTKTLHCLQISASVAAMLEGDLGLVMDDVDVYLVEDPAVVTSVLGMASAGATIVLVLSPEAYAVALTISVGNVVLVGGGADAGRRLASGGPPTVLLAPPGKRHLRITGNCTVVTDNVVFQASLPDDGSSSSSSDSSDSDFVSGGVELDGPNARGVFINTQFQDCRAAGAGGGLLLRNGAAAAVRGGSAFLRNTAQQGGAVYVGGPGSALTLGPDAMLIDNSAIGGLAGSGGSGVFVDKGQFMLGINVTWNGNAGDDVAAAGADVQCADAGYAPSIDCGSDCSGAFLLPSDCPLCSPASGARSCSQCPIGSWGGRGAGLGCRHCPLGETTDAAGSTSSSDCVPITTASSPRPTSAPTPVALSDAPPVLSPPEGVVGAPVDPTAAPTERTSWGRFTNRPSARPLTRAPTANMPARPKPTLAPTISHGRPPRPHAVRFVRLNLTIGGGQRRRVRVLMEMVDVVGRGERGKGKT
jgi:hypothetical protein